MRQIYTITQGPSAEPVTLNQAAEHCRIDSRDDLPYIGELISVAREYYDALTGRSSAKIKYLLTASRWDDLFDKTPKPNDRTTPRDLYAIPICRSPLVTIESVRYYADGSETITTMPTTDYRVATTGELGFIQLKDEPPATEERLDAIQIAFTSGGDCSAMSKHAIKMLVAHYYEQRTPVAFTSIQGIPHTLQAIIDNQRIRGHFA